MVGILWAQDSSGMSAIDIAVKVKNGSIRRILEDSRWW